ncbi:phosphate ABC transporter permease subunit PstC [Clostridioides mangenotii]|uniref:phosphate ABC transporter permease subunit PstC n=1 Tax=Metaclostridioides mangenotii TaxID=1540 RepID=UPI00214A08DD|nr:phosphate ABC transporter permease subunit PstC [Clostridioides mangenotii]MCR1955639.1 phosphate ABC transporter permease subunit PstC [Clostridioides mangenotii]
MVIKSRKVKIEQKSDISNKNNRQKYLVEKITENIFMFSALLGVACLFLIIGFVFFMGLKPFIIEGYSFIEFIFGSKWIPSAEKFGILPMIVASLFGTMGALLIGVPIGILTAVYIAELAPKKVSKVVSSAIELLAGIPSVLYGIFGIVVIVPAIQNIFNIPKGQTLLAVIIVLSIMVLPTIVSVSETAIRAVPKEYKEGSLALGASHIETIFKVILPAAKSGLLSAVVLGLGRALGETMAIILVAGNLAILPSSVLDSVRPLTTNIALEMGYAYGVHQEMLFATGAVLFVFILVLNLILNKISNKMVK